MSEVPAELKYASSHEWTRLESDGSVVVGITDHAQDALGDVVYIELPEVGAHVDAGSEVAVIESVKAASDIYSPVTGDVTEINPGLEDEPESVNSSPYGDGWLFRIMPTDVSSMGDLMDAEAYAASVEE
jgi:glycine cleavage system H protein